MTVQFPSSLDRLTPEIMTGLLAEQHPGAVVTYVNVIETANRGDGVASTADRVALELAYDGDPGLPSRMLLKTVLLHRAMRFGPSAIQMSSAIDCSAMGGVYLVEPRYSSGDPSTPASLPTSPSGFAVTGRDASAQDDSVFVIGSERRSVPPTVIPSEARRAESRDLGGRTSLLTIPLPGLS